MKNMSQNISVKSCIEIYIISRQYFAGSYYKVVELKIEKSDKT